MYFKPASMKVIPLILILFVLSGFITDEQVSIKGFTGSKPDTLNIAYTYWQPSGGPFTGLCGNPYSLVFTGTVTKLYDRVEHHPTGKYAAAVLYVGQKGIINITEIKLKQPPVGGYQKKPGHNYSGETIFSSDCFYNSRLNEGDKVIVFVYSYEGEYCIPGNSILRIEDFNDSIVLSIEKYIKSNQDPLSIRTDTTLWRKYQLDYALKQIIECKLSNTNEK
jgi:hypothetical protein